EEPPHQPADYDEPAEQPSHQPAGPAGHTGPADHAEEPQHEPTGHDEPAEEPQHQPAEPTEPTEPTGPAEHAEEPWRRPDEEPSGEWPAMFRRPDPATAQPLPPGALGNIRDLSRLDDFIRRVGPPDPWRSFDPLRLPDPWLLSNGGLGREPAWLDSWGP